MVTINTPGSIYVDNNNASTYTLSWAGSIAGQNAYEILYRSKGASAWLTMGKVTSTATSYDLRQIYPKLSNCDFTEIEYRVLLYYSTTNSTGTLTGTEYSQVFEVIFNSGIAGYHKIQTGTNARSEVPIFSSINNPSVSKLKMQTDKGIKQIPLVDSSSPLAPTGPKWKFRTDSGVKIAAGKTGRFGAAYMPAGAVGEFNQGVVRYTPIYRTENYISAAGYNYQYITGYTTRYRIASYRTEYQLTGYNTYYSIRSNAYYTRYDYTAQTGEYYTSESGPVTTIYYYKAHSKYYYNTNLRYDGIAYHTRTAPQDPGWHYYIYGAAQYYTKSDTYYYYESRYKNVYYSAATGGYGGPVYGAGGRVVGSYSVTTYSYFIKYYYTVTRHNVYGTRSYYQFHNATYNTHHSPLYSIYYRIASYSTYYDTNYGYRYQAPRYAYKYVFDYNRNDSYNYNYRTYR